MATPSVQHLAGDVSNCTWGRAHMHHAHKDAHTGNSFRIPDGQFKEKIKQDIPSVYVREKEQVRENPGQNLCRSHLKSGTGSNNARRRSPRPCKNIKTWRLTPTTCCGCLPNEFGDNCSLRLGLITKLRKVPFTSAVLSSVRTELETPAGWVGGT
ncbi:hypothetical protein CBL_13782 [Carabus blaptoides fortunei]